MKPQWKKIISIVLVVAALGALVYFIKNSTSSIEYQQGLYPVNPSLAGEKIVLSDYVRYPGDSGKNALELLKLAVDGNIEVKEYDFGSFVESIGGVKPDADHFWKLYV